MDFARPKYLKLAFRPSSSSMVRERWADIRLHQQMVKPLYFLNAGKKTKEWNYKGAYFAKGKERKKIVWFLEFLLAETYWKYFASKKY